MPKKIKKKKLKCRMKSIQIRKKTMKKKIMISKTMKERSLKMTKIRNKMRIWNKIKNWNLKWKKLQKINQMKLKRKKSSHLLIRHSSWRSLKTQERTVMDKPVMYFRMPPETTSNKTDKWVKNEAQARA